MALLVATLARRICRAAMAMLGIAVAAAVAGTFFATVNAL